MKIIIIKKWWFLKKWSFQLVSDNGNILVWSSKYWNKKDMLDTIDLIQREAANCEIVYKYPER